MLQCETGPIEAQMVDKQKTTLGAGGHVGFGDSFVGRRPAGLVAVAAARPQGVQKPALLSWPFDAAAHIKF